MNINFLNSQLEQLRQHGNHEEADQLQIQIGQFKSQVILSSITSLFHPSIISLIDEPIKASDDNHELYLIRFKEGTKVRDILNNFPFTYWQASLFIPVVGIEVPVNRAKSILEEIKAMDSFVKVQKTYLFHEYSFTEI